MNLPRHRLNRIAAAGVLLACAPVHATGFVYEGRLDDGGAPANGRYDLRLSPLADAKSGAALAAPIVFEDVPVVDGRFRIDFELPLATVGAAWIEVAVRDGSAVGAFSTIPGRSEAVTAKAIGACWSSTGDSATNPAVNFLGTTDAQPLVLRVQNQPVVRYEPSAFLFGGQPATANVIAGAASNIIFAGVRGAVIAGGGMPADSDPSLFGEAPNRVNDDFGTVGGGYANLAGDQLIDVLSAFSATVGGGNRNHAGGAVATVGGGELNHAIGVASTIAGGSSNTATGASATIAGGGEHTASGPWSTVGGGSENVASGQNATIAGGRSNVASTFNATVGGGLDNEATGTQATVSGGRSNLAADESAAVSGGSQNRALAVNATIIGGQANEAANPSATVAGGSGNCAGGQVSWVAGLEAKARPGTGIAFPVGSGCAGVPVSGDANGDEGTFVWNGGTTDFVSTGPRQFLVNSPNGVAINVNDPAGNALRVAGTLRVDTLGTSASTTLCRNANNQISGCSSSARYKEHITDLELGLAVVERLRPVAYDWKETREADVGFVAEEIAAIDPRLVTRNAAGEIEGVKYERLTAVLAGAVQELTRTLAAREVDDRALRERQDRLEARLDALLGAPRGGDASAAAR
ncbi:MAG: tail fiber domain-containing protein [Pseudomonadota bacterium]